MTKQKYISPIAIDLGAKNTGVYFAHYREGSSLDDIQERAGKVYQLDKNSYTLLMAERTATRHQRRGYDRRQMVKRLFKLIWEKHFGFPWDKDVQQTISFLLNRRGFSFLTEEYDIEQLRQFPQAAYEKLPDELQFDPDIKSEYDFAGAIEEWTQLQDAEKFIKEKCKAIETSIYVAKLREACDQYTRQGKYEDGKRDSSKLRDLDQDIFNRLKSIGVKGLEQAETENYRSRTKEGEDKTYPYSYGNKVNLEAYINHAGKTESIFESICALDSNAGGTDPDLWDFNTNNFNPETAVFGQPDETKENSKKGKNDNKKWIKTHLHHLAFAFHKTLGELQSSGRHRSKYFEDIKAVLDNKSHTHNYLKRFCDKLTAGKYQHKGQVLDEQKLRHLIGHLSNLELKPLRKYFNDKRHKNGDYWDENRLTEKFENWILREWRVNPQKDKLKADGKYSYKKLKNKWENKKSGKVVNFWLETNPNLTIPPYQDNNNRRPPKCQSLILNPSYLDDRYSDWREWLDDLKEIKDDETFLDGFEDALDKSAHFTDDLDELIRDSQRKYEGKHGKAMSNRQTKTLEKQIKLGTRTKNDHLKARVLQFILDRVKDDDPFKLNEIYSHAKKYRQKQSTPEEKRKAKDQLEKAIGDSALLEELKTPRNYENEAIFEAGTFLHLVCKYYKQRQRARDGRIFIHPEYRYVKDRGYQNTGRFDDKNHLLTYCNHKPRQKRYQLLNDLAGLLQVSPDELEKHAKKHVKEQDEKETDEKIDKWLSGIEHLKTNCARAAKEQKDRRGSLKLDIQSVFGLIYHKKQSESPSDKEVKKILKESKVSDPLKLYSFCKRAKGLCLEITKDLYTDDSRQQQWEKDLKKNPASAVYFLAQINNLVFKERSGNATTCAVCSADNAQRMIQRKATKDKDGTAAKAARLPAIPTRLIDGAVMRMARIVGGAITEDKWEKIKGELEQGNEVCIPIITESNRFEFEPNLKELKGKKSSEKGSAEQLFSDKRDRIKQASRHISTYSGKYLEGGSKVNLIAGVTGHISAYSGKYLEGDKFDESTEELDHIIPRSSNYGVLNDEANLICVTQDDNKEKGKKEYDLKDLAESYKNKVLGFSDRQKIEDWIIEQIWDEKNDQGEFTFEGDKFKFGTYRSFINLKPDEQKAFRHALFLQGHPLREKVIGAIINNRNRALVNGTQRYFAEVLANDLYKKAKRIGRENQISFDFFGVEAQSISRGENIKDLRDAYEKIDDELKKYAKQKGKSQHLYSHLIDAQLAFAIAVDAHRDDGSLKLKIDDSTTPLWPFSRDTGEIFENNINIFNAIKVSEKEFDESEGARTLKRRGLKENFFTHRILFDSNARAWHFLKLIEIETSDKSSTYLKGFLDLTALKSCLRKDDWQDAINKQYGHNDGNGKFLPYGKLLSEKDTKKVVDLYKRFGYQNEKQRWPKVMIENQKLGGDYFTIRLYQIDKTKVAQFLLEHFNTKSDPNDWKDEDCKIFTQLQSLWYFTKRESLIDQQKPNFSYKPDNLKTDDFINPSLLKAWKELNDKWLVFIRENDETKYFEFLRSHFLDFPGNEKTRPPDHQRVRKEFSLPVKSIGQGFRLIKRNSWNGEVIHQCQSLKNVAGGVKYEPYFDKKTEKFVNVLPLYVRSEGIVLMKTINKLKDALRHPDDPNLRPVNENEWYSLPVPSDLKEGLKDTDIICVKIKHQDAERYTARITVSSIEGLSLPQDKTDWKGKVRCHKDKPSLDKVQDKDKNNNYHCLSSDYKWFSKPFARQDRPVSFHSSQEGIIVEFTISKTKKIGDYLSTCMKNQS